ncbi:MAG: hypothetical protein KIT31_05315 [Deltaproteobacteria bacterium]|nr:hypothetical protein [Deltaproteobacteria bacterium]
MKRCWWSLIISVQLVAGTAVADDTPNADDAQPRVPAVPADSRALPIALLAVGIPLVTTGLLAIAIDGDVSDLAPTYRDSAPAGVMAVISGGAMTAVGTFLYLRRRGTNGGTRPALKWTGATLLAGAVAAGALALKFDHDYRVALDEIAALCDLNCADPRLAPVRLRRDRAADHADIFLGTSGALVVGGVLLYFASRRANTAGPQVQVTRASASVGWSTTF